MPGFAVAEGRAAQGGAFLFSAAARSSQGLRRCFQGIRRRRTEDLADSGAAYGSENRPEALVIQPLVEKYASVIQMVGAEHSELQSAQAAPASHLPFSWKRGLSAGGHSMSGFWRLSTSV